MTRAPEDAQLLAVALCAQWCGVCREWRPVFERVVAAGTGTVTARWIDIEDEATLVGDDFEVEAFPSLLLARDGEPLFLGAVPPQPEALMRLLQAARAGSLAPLQDASSRALLARVQARDGAP